MNTLFINFGTHTFGLRVTGNGPYVYPWLEGQF